MSRRKWGARKNISQVGRAVDPLSRRSSKQLTGCLTACVSACVALCVLACKYLISFAIWLFKLIFTSLMAAARWVYSAVEQVLNDSDKN